MDTDHLNKNQSCIQGASSSILEQPQQEILYSQIPVEGSC